MVTKFWHVVVRENKRGEKVRCLEQAELVAYWAPSLVVPLLGNMTQRAHGTIDSSENSSALFALIGSVPESVLEIEITFPH